MPCFEFFDDGGRTGVQHPRSIPNPDGTDRGAEHDPCNILAHRLFRTPGGAQNPQ